MTGLEIALFVLGAAFIVISFFIIDGSEAGAKAPSENDVSRETIRRISADAIEDINRKSDTIIAESEDRLEALSNDKIIAVGEYSDQVIEKINSNHKEVVFLYQMLSDKEEELKSTAMKLDNIRIECEKLIKSEVALEVQRSNDNGAEAAQGRHVVRKQEPEHVIADPAAEMLKQELKKAVNHTPAPAPKAEQVKKQENKPEEAEISVSPAEAPKPVKEPPKTEAEKAAEEEVRAALEKMDPQERALEEARMRARAAARERAQAHARSMASANASGKTAAGRSADANEATANVKDQRAKRQMVPVEAEGRDNKSLSRNEEIIKLYKQGKNVMEISKLLGMGQGEVRLIINLYGTKR